VDAVPGDEHARPESVSLDAEDPVHAPTVGADGPAS